MFPQINTYMLLVQKFSFVLGSILYLLFAFIVVKQTTMMSKNVSDKFNTVLITFAYLHAAFAIFLVFLTLTIL
ncbi:hypothetical protein HYV64_00390 [Candidatus Shapirobacteria bacterium]|nr:hypothetical protein [Candidatus Shapirobacteria bacterium]